MHILISPVLISTVFPAHLQTAPLASNWSISQPKLNNLLSGTSDQLMTPNVHHRQTQVSIIPIHCIVWVNIIIFMIIIYNFKKGPSMNFGHT